MKIAIDLTSLADNFSGIERFALSITKELIKDQDKEFILIFKDTVHKAFAQPKDNVKCVVLKRCNKFLFQQIVLPACLLFIKADYYLFLAFPAPYFFFSKKAISAIHDISCWDCPQTNKKHMALYFKLLYRKASWNNKKVITVSNFSKSRIVHVLNVAPDNIVVAYNGISENLFQNDHKDEIYDRIKEKYHLPDQYLLCLSTLEPRKNLKLLIDAYVHLTEQEIGVELVLAGRKGWMVDNLLEGVSESAADRIHFTGFIEDEDLPVVYKLAKCFVFPSLYEGFGIPPVEAMAMRTLVISSDAASMPEVLGDAAFYFESRNQTDLEYAIQQVFALDQKEIEEKLVKGEKLARSYQWDKSAAIIADMLR